jgi:oligopeptidase A
MTENLKNDNPFLVREGIPPFEKMRAEDVVPAMEQVLAEVTKQLLAIEANVTPTWNGLMQPLEALDTPFEYAWGPVNHLLGVKNADDLRQAHEEIQPKVVELGLRIDQSRAIYQAAKTLRDGDEWDRLDEAQQRAVELKLRNAEHAGVGLDGAAKERFQEISRQLARLNTDFSNHVLDAKKQFELIIDDEERTAGWPQTLKRGAAQSYTLAREDDASSIPAAADEADQQTGPWRITLDYPSYGPFMQHHRDRAEREHVYRASMTVASSGEYDNTDLITQTLRLRQEKAKLLGYGTYAQFSLASKMAADVDAVTEMCDALKAPSRPHAEADLKDLRDLAAESAQQEPLERWDLAFWSERLRERRFDYTDDELRPYFPLPKVLDGLFGLTERLFDVTIEAADGEAPVWHEDVRYFRVLAANGDPVATFYLDPYSRPQEKQGGAWFDECLSRRVLDGARRLPVVYLCCNGTPPVGETPSLMSFSEVLTLFHEFGHGTQGMLTTVNYADVSGLSGVEWDAVELASQFLENFCYHRETLLGLTEHVETGECLPDELFEKIVASRNFQAGTQTLRQLEFAKTDIRLHDGYDTDGVETPFDVYRAIAQEMSVMSPLEGDRFLCSFGHIFAGGYAAGYYSYKWSEVLSADVFGAFEEAGLDNPEAMRVLGRKYRDTILALGGGRHPMDVFRDFRGREPDAEALLRQQGLIQ